MALQLVSTSKYGRRWEDDTLDQNGRRGGYINCTIDPQFYEDEPGDGNFRNPVNMRAVRTNNAQLNGWRVVDNGYHFAVQTRPAQQNQPPRGTVAFGARQGTRWVRFRLFRCGVYSDTDGVTDILGQPDYSNTPTSSQFERNTAKHPDLPDDIRTTKVGFEWPDIWTTPNGGTISIRWRLVSDLLKEDIVIDPLARTYLESQYGSDPDALFGFAFQFDNPNLIERIQGRRGELRDELDRLIAFLPADYAYVARVGGRRDLEKRFFRRNGNFYLFVGARVGDLLSMPTGTLIFDPAMTQETVQASDDDGQLNNGVTWTTGTTFIGVGEYAYRMDAWFEFTPDVPQGASFTGGGSEFATLSCYRHSGYGFYGTSVTVDVATDVGTAQNSPLSTTFPTDANVTLSTSQQSATVTSVGGAGSLIGGGFDCAGCLEERVGDAGWTANDIVRIGVIDDGTSNDDSFWIAAQDDSQGPSALDAFYTTGGGTTFNQAVAGSLTAAGALTRLVEVTRTGSITAAGTVAGVFQGGATTFFQSVGGSITAAGSLSATSVFLLSLSGSLTPSGDITNRTIFLNLAGSITASGALSRLISVSFGGSITPSSLTRRLTALNVSGAITPTGTLQTGVRLAESVSGSLTMAGAVAGVLLAPPNLAAGIAKVRCWMGRMIGR